MQRLPQLPQWLGSMLVLTSQPLATTPSQSAKPALQLPILHTPPTHAGVPLGTTQTVLQPPQWFGSLLVLVSQPSVGLLSQSEKPGLQLPILHTPPAHAGVALGTTHTLPQLPQWFGSPLVLVSQPSSGLPLQSPKPVLHVPTAHTPPSQPGVALGTL